MKVFAKTPCAQARRHLRDAIVAQPIRRSPVRGELLASYVHRLARANQLDVNELLRSIAHSNTPATSYVIRQPRIQLPPPTTDLRAAIAHTEQLRDQVQKYWRQHPSPNRPTRPRWPSRDPPAGPKRIRWPLEVDSAFVWDLSLNQTGWNHLAILANHPAAQLRQTLVGRISNKDTEPRPSWGIHRRETWNWTFPACDHCRAARHGGDQILLGHAARAADLPQAPALDRLLQLALGMAARHRSSRHHRTT
jgi:hypothetical protein